eukprot:366209-Chlamydomonas_euryale.AAC.24
MEHRLANRAYADSALVRGVDEEVHSFAAYAYAYSRACKRATIAIRSVSLTQLLTCRTRLL